MGINKANYSEYTTDEIIEFADSKAICPFDWGLPVLPVCKEGEDSEECNRCWKAAIGPMSNPTPLALFESNALTVLKDLAIQEKRYKELATSRDELKTTLLGLMEQYGITKFDNDNISIAYVKERTGTKFDTTRFKKDHPELYKQYLTETHTKASIRFKTNG